MFPADILLNRIGMMNNVRTVSLQCTFWWLSNKQRNVDLRRKYIFSYARLKVMIELVLFFSLFGVFMWTNDANRIFFVLEISQIFMQHIVLCNRCERMKSQLCEERNLQNIQFCIYWYQQTQILYYSPFLVTIFTLSSVQTFLFCFSINRKEGITEVVSLPL